MSKYVNNTRLVRIVPEDNRFVGYNSDNEIVMSYWIADPVSRAKQIQTWIAEGKYEK
jgi:hypothetical protein|tara:strand:+ start:342 stop:512 length:171 start_codon:yes stop_codon:yes gene_type:complete